MRAQVSPITHAIMARPTARPVPRVRSLAPGWIMMLLLVGTSALLSAAPPPPAPALPQLHLDPHSVTISGVSSGAAMTNQLAVAFSASFAGAAAFAGKPWNCEQVSTPGFVRPTRHGSNTCNKNVSLVVVDNLVAAAIAVGETVSILLAPPSPPLLKHPLNRERGVQQNDRTLADG